MNNKISSLVAKHLWAAGCVTIKSKPTFRWASGILSPIYNDNRLLLSYPKGRTAIVEAFADIIKMRRLGCDVVAGVATSGIPIAAILADRLNKPLVYVRPQAKAHGKGRQIEGNLKRGARVILIEDLISTGGSSFAAAQALKAAGGKVAHILCTFAYLPDQIAELAQAKKAPAVIHLTDADTLLKVGLQRKYIGAAKEKAARRFLGELARVLSL